MKNKLILLTIMLIGNNLLAQQIDTLYFNSSWQSSNINDFTYYRIVEKLDNKLKVIEYDKAGQIQMEGIYESLEPEIEDGHFIFYKKNKKEIEGDFSKRMMVNKWIYYNEKGRIEKKIDYDYQLKIDETLNFEELYEKVWKIGRLVEEMPVFNNGNLDNFKSYILSNFNYPPIPRKYGLNGKVVLLFIINKKGEIINPKIKDSIHPDIDNEIMRIISIAPNWRPALQKNQLIDIPIGITFEIH